MRFLCFTFLLITNLLLTGLYSVAQDSIPTTKRPAKIVNKAAVELQKSLEDDPDELKTARRYEELAKQLISTGEHAKAEEYLKKALDIYTKHKKQREKTIVTRNLARVQESQNKIGPAIKNYSAATKLAEDKDLKQINSNDANRLMDRSMSKQASLASSNIDLLKKTGNKEEIVDAYKQMAEVNLQQNDKEVAIKNLNEALVIAKDKPAEVINLKKEIAKVYASDEQYDQAITINEQLLSKAKKLQDFDTQIKQSITLSDLYLKQKQEKKAVDFLMSAYKLSLKKGKTLEAKESLTLLSDYYKTKGDNTTILSLYTDFFNHFEQLIKSDSSLIDAKVFQNTEQRIRELEKERALKDELISKKNIFNYFLIGSVAIMLLFLCFIIKALYSIKVKNKKIALQSLRRETNPHFIFNSLNSVNQFISQNNELAANKYLSSYSTLMRNTMENSNKDFVLLSMEIEQLKKYLDLEHLRFADQFDYKINVDESLEIEVLLIPNMLIQPHLENAIWHGLRYKESKGLLKLSFISKEKNLQVIIEDNGIGLKKSAELKTVNQKTYTSLGLKNTYERISLLNGLYHIKISLHISERPCEDGSGTRVEINVPLITKI